MEQHNNPQHSNPYVEQPAYRLSENPENAVHDMMTVIDEINDFYERENSALVESDTKGFIELQNQKMSIAQRYYDGVSQIVARKEEIKNVDPVLKQALQERQNTFAALSSKNKEYLQRMMRTTERLGERIQKAAKQCVQKERSVNYGSTGRLDTDTARSLSTGSISETA